MAKEELDFYSKTNLKSYDLDSSMRYQLSMLDNLDVFTRKHCENVANLTCRICEYLKCNKQFTVFCTICAYLHDIGKLFVPPEILQKPGKLTDEEYAIMKTHTTIGYDMCMRDLKLRPYASGTRSHHEALDGSGYPDGLKGKCVPYEAQIIRVADEYDAITSKRQYKTHIGISDTLKILIDHAHPNPSVALESLSFSAKIGKIDPKILKSLFKVVINDIEYEISCVYDYIKSLKNEIVRLEQIQDYQTKMEISKKDKDKQYYQEGMKMLFSKGETFENYLTILSEYTKALEIRNGIVDTLFKEIKTIKKLKI